MFDVFYKGDKPNLFPFEQTAANIDEAAALSRTEYFWFIHGNADYTGFDFSWRCVPWESTQVHVFASQHQRDGGVYFAHKEHATQHNWNFRTEQTITRLVDKNAWIIPQDIDDSGFDYSWHPDGTEPDYNYHFGTQWHPAGGPVYKGTAGNKCVDSPRVKKIANKARWAVPPNIDDSEFDYSWHPDPFGPDYEYHFGTQWHATGGPVYKGTAGIKLSIDQRVRATVDMSKWIVPPGIDDSGFDYSWHPDPMEPDYEYHFGTQWQTSGGPVYKGSRGKKLVDTQKVKSIIDMSRWKIPAGIDDSGFDYSWHPSPMEPDYEYHFGTQWQSAGGPVYKGTRGPKLVQGVQSVRSIIDMNNWVVPDGIDDSEFDYSWHPHPFEPPYEYHFGTQWQTAGGPIYKGTAGVKTTSAQRVKTLVDMSNWVVPAGIDDSEFDYSWHPSPFDPDYEYHFPTQHQKEGGPVYKGTAGVKYASNQKIKMSATQIFYMDFLNPESETQFKVLQLKHPDIKRTRYVNDHLNVMKRIANMATTEFVWVISSICDYTDFDFTWHPDMSQREMIHCFNNQFDDKRGDTFYIHVESFKRQMVELELLDWFNVINYVTDDSLRRFESPICVYEGDDLITTIKNYEFKTPYAIFTKEKATRLFGHRIQNCIWTEKDRIAKDETMDKSGCCIPRDAKAYIKTQVYDYPYLCDETMRNIGTVPSLDVVFIDNGEPDADRYFNHLFNILTVEQQNYPTLRYDNSIHRVSGVNGRAAAYKAAAAKSTTDWFFAVFAKLEVNKDFDWDWQPDYWQGPKHYIFNAKNPLNGLTYGHQGMIAYNRRLVLANDNPGIDFTLTQAHESVPLLSGVANFNQDPWMTWRTAFREVVKLKHFSTTAPSVETDYRLKIWTTRAEGTHAEWCLRGAQDAVEYFDSVAGAYDKLMLTFEWTWLRQYFDAKY